MTYSTRPPVNPRLALPFDELDGELRRFFRKRSGRRPFVLPVIMEI